MVFRQLIFASAPALALFYTSALPQVATGGSYTLIQSAIGDPGGRTNGGAYSMDTTLAQILAGGPIANSPYSSTSGFQAGFAPVDCLASPGCEGDINRIASGVRDGRLDGDDLIWFDLFANGVNCTTSTEFQRMDVAPRAPTLGDGALSLDRTQLEKYIA